jgi:hypothetical protein
MSINQMNFIATFYEIQLVTVQNVRQYSMNSLARSKQEFIAC